MCAVPGVLQVWNTDYGVGYYTADEVGYYTTEKLVRIYIDHACDVVAVQQESCRQHGLQC